MSGSLMRRVSHGGGESYFISLNDLLVGMLFVFIILLMAFALNYRSATDKLQNELNERRDVRSALLDQLQRELGRQGINQVVIDKQNGILRLPERTLFSVGSADLDRPGHQALQVLSKALAHLLPCYGGPRTRRANCPIDSQPILEAVYVEGHTDNAPIHTQLYRDNLALSSARAITTFEHMQDYQPELKNIKNASGSATLFGVSAYGEQRPIDGPNSNLTEAGRAKNRRIDVRFLLAPPASADLSLGKLALDAQ